MTAPGADQRIAEIQEAFSVFDKNANGTVVIDELETVLRSLGQEPSAADLQLMMSQADIDGNAAIDFPEFSTMMAKQLDDADLEREMAGAFKVFDSDENGFISASELGAVMLQLGENLSSEELTEMINEADASGDDKISFDEFAAMMASE